VFLRCGDTWYIWIWVAINPLQPLTVHDDCISNLTGMYADGHNSTATIHKSTAAITCYADIAVSTADMVSKSVLLGQDVFGPQVSLLWRRSLFLLRRLRMWVRTTVGALYLLLRFSTMGLLAFYECEFSYFTNLNTHDCRCIAFAFCFCFSNMALPWRRSLFLVCRVRM